MRTDGSARSHFPITTFCWLPPERARTAFSVVGVRMDRRSTRPATASRSRALWTTPNEARRSRLGRATFSRTERPITRPSFFRSSVRRATPRFTAALGRRKDTLRPKSVTSPRCGRAPKRALASSVLPAPTRPYSPVISPHRRVKETSLTSDPERRLRTPRASSPTWLAFGGKTWASFRPTIRVTRLSRSVSATGIVRTRRPSLSTVTWSARRKTSSRW